MTENKRFRMTETELIFMVLDNEKALSRKEIVDKLNNLTDENEDLKKEIERITKDKENWAFISDCSVQVMNEEEKFKEDYLRIATNNLKKLQEENEKLKQFKTRTFEILTHNIQEASEWKKLDMSDSEKRRLQFLEIILIGIEKELENE